MFSSMKVGTRLAIAFGVVVVLLSAVIAVGVNRMAAINEGLRVVTEENNAEMAHAVAMRSAGFQLSVSVRSLMLYTDAAKSEKEFQTAKNALESFDTHMSGLGKMFEAIAGTTPAEKELLAKIKSSWGDVRPIYLHTAELGSALKHQDAYKYYFVDSDGSNKNIAFRETIQELIDLEGKLSEEEVTKAVKTYQEARNLMLTLGGAAILLAVLAAFLVTRSILTQLGGEPAYAAELLQTVADGNLDVDVKVKAGDDSSMRLKPPTAVISASASSWRVSPGSRNRWAKA